MLQRLQFLTAGESHGKGLVGILEGFPAGLTISEEYINQQLKRRQIGHGRGNRMKIENDQAEIFSGVRHGKTIGSPISLIIQNRDWVNWTNKMSIDPPDTPVAEITLPRPGHADLAGIQKFGFTDIRNVLERSSARETAMRVGIGAICRKLLDELGVEVGSWVTQIHKAQDNSGLPEDITPNKINDKADQSPVRCLDKKSETEMIKVIDEALKNGDSVGGIFEIIVTGLPYGLGTYTHWSRKLQTRISAALLSVNAFKGIEIGAGFNSGSVLGSELHDEIFHDGERFYHASNNAGGIEGGMSNSQPLRLRIVMKPIPTLMKPLHSVDIKSLKAKPAHKERTDSCAVPAASVIAESMVSIVLADAFLEKFGGDSLSQLKEHIKISGKY